MGISGTTPPPTPDPMTSASTARPTPDQTTSASTVPPPAASKPAPMTAASTKTSVKPARAAASKPPAASTKPPPAPPSASHKPTPMAATSSSSLARAAAAVDRKKNVDAGDQKQSLIDTAEKQRHNKREQKRQSFRVRMEAEQLLSQGGANRQDPDCLYDNGKPVVDAQGNPVTQDELNGMIEQFAHQNNTTVEEAIDYLNNSKTDVQTFVCKYEAWRTGLEQEIDLDDDDSTDRDL